MELLPFRHPEEEISWGTQSVVTDATLAGNGTTAIPLRIADNGVTSAKIADDAVGTADAGQ
ncbi:MAG: hypothetical protein MZV63_56900 [Marinilabiliales bacterium]|nr:hypothetical protein [Marinilabiliales bacterium]